MYCYRNSLISVAILVHTRARCEVAKGGDTRGGHRPVNARSTGHRVVIKGLPR